MDVLRNLFSRTLGLGSADKVLDELSLEGVARYIKSDKCEYLCVCRADPQWNYYSFLNLSFDTGKNIICMVGAGISTCECPVSLAKVNINIELIHIFYILVQYAFFISTYSGRNPRFPFTRDRPLCKFEEI